MNSNNLNFKTYIVFETFNEESPHKLIIKINNQTIFEKEFEKNKVHTFKLNEFFDYKKAGSTTINFIWNGNQECANKYFKLYRVIINEQTMPIWQVRLTPFENEYIKKLKETEKGKQEYRNSILFPGTRHGWYGEYKLNFMLGNKHEIMTAQEHTIEPYLGAQSHKILTDPDTQMYQKVAQKK